MGLGGTDLFPGLTDRGAGAPWLPLGEEATGSGDGRDFLQVPTAVISRGDLRMRILEKRENKWMKAGAWVPMAIEL